MMPGAWLAALGPAERQRWESFERRVLEEIERKWPLVSIVAVPGEHRSGDVQAAIELGLAVMADKPIVALVGEGGLIPENLERLARAVVEVQADLDTPAGQAEAMAKLKPFLARFAPGVSSPSTFPPDNGGEGGG